MKPAPARRRKAKRRFPAEVLTHDEAAALMAVRDASTAVGLRNRARIAVMCRAGLIARQLGHQSITTTARYLDHLNPTAVIGVMCGRMWVESRVRAVLLVDDGSELATTPVERRQRRALHRCLRIFASVTRPLNNAITSSRSFATNRLPRHPMQALRYGKRFQCFFER